MSTLKMMGIVAVGMAGLAISKRDHGVMALARAKYGSTLLSINDAITVREEVAKESTLAAVTMMARFEVRCWRMLGLLCFSETNGLRLLLVRIVLRKRLGSVICKVLRSCFGIGPRTSGTR